MAFKKIPLYVLCASHTLDQEAFLTQYCRDKQPMIIRLCRDTHPPEATAGMYWLAQNLSPQDAGKQIVAWCHHANADSIWLQWQDSQSIGWLLAIMTQPTMADLCTLSKIVRIANAEDAQALQTCAQPILQEQLTQCNLYVLSNATRTQLAETRRAARVFQPDIEVMAAPHEIASVLYSKDIVQPLRVSLILGLCVLILALLPHFSLSITSSISIFLGTFLQALPFLMLGIFLSSAIQVFIPADFLQRVFPKKRWSGMLFAILGGFLMPICDCASIPVFRSLLKKGVPLPAAVTFMLCAPVINPVVMLSTYYAFGGNVRIMLARMGFGIVCSLVIGLLFSKTKKEVLLNRTAVVTCSCGQQHVYDLAENHDTQNDCHCAHHDLHLLNEKATPHEHHPATQESCVRHKKYMHDPQRVSAILQGFKALIVHFTDEFFEVAKFLLIGIGVSTLIQLGMGTQMTGMSINNLLESMLFMIAMAFLLSLCSSSDAVVGKNMGSALPFGAVMVFLVFGPMMDIKNLILMSSSFTKQFMLKLFAATVIVCFMMVYIAFSLGLGGLLV